MAQVYLGLGSNIDKQASLNRGLQLLETHYGQLYRSAIYLSQAVGFDGPDFYNLVVSLTTTESLPDLCHQLRTIEYRCGRALDAKKCSSRTLDIDILLYDDVICDSPCILPRPEICFNAYVLRPLAELAGSLLHPVTAQPLRQMWSNLAAKALPLSRIDDYFLTDSSIFYEHHSCSVPSSYSGIY